MYVSHCMIYIVCNYFTRKTSASTLYKKVEALQKVCLHDGDTFSAIEPFRPIIDGVMFTDQVLNAFRDGEWHKHKELIIGTNTQEAGKINAIFNTLPENDRITLDRFQVIYYIP